MNRSELENRIRDEIKDYPSPNPTPGKLDCFEWDERIVLSRWSWFWKKIQFWHYKVIRLDRNKVLWRYR